VNCWACAQLGVKPQHPPYDYPAIGDTWHNVINPTLPSDPAYSLMTDSFTSTPAIHREGCYICEDPEYAQMGLPLCRLCPKCSGHVPADDDTCDDCGHVESPEDYE
jgi:hypothetical protein